MMILAAENNPLIPDWGELILGFIAFAILVAVLVRLAFPSIERLYHERREAIEGGIRRAEEAQAEAQRTLQQYRAQLADARHEANRIREEARAQGQEIIDELRRQAQEEADRIRRRGEEQLAAERASVVVELRAEIGRLAVDLAERIVGESLQDDTRVRTTVDRFLDHVESGAQTAGEATAPTGGG
jgi:F-type H+-transporting ATPase subunit b